MPRWVCPHLLDLVLPLIAGQLNFWKEFTNSKLNISCCMAQGHFSYRNYYIAILIGIFICAVSVTVKNRNLCIFVKPKNRYLGILWAMNGFGISVFSDTSNTLSLCTCELFSAIYILLPGTLNKLSFDVFLCSLLLPLLLMLILFFDIVSESKNKCRYRYCSTLPNTNQYRPNVKLSIL